MLDFCLRLNFLTVSTFFLLWTAGKGIRYVVFLTLVVLGSCIHGGGGSSRLTIEVLTAHEPGEAEWLVCR
jgi:hypothetical protein